MLLWWNPTACDSFVWSRHHRFFHRAHLSRLSFRHQRARRAALCGKYDWHADWRSRPGNGDSSGYRRHFGPTYFPGNDSGVPDHFGGDTIRIVFIVYATRENTFDLKIRENAESGKFFRMSRFSTITGIIESWWEISGTPWITILQHYQDPQSLPERSRPTNFFFIVVSVQSGKRFLITYH